MDYNNQNWRADCEVVAIVLLTEFAFHPVWLPLEIQASVLSSGINNFHGNTAAQAQDTRLQQMHMSATLSEYLQAIFPPENPLDLPHLIAAANLNGIGSHPTANNSNEYPRQDSAEVWQAHGIDLLKYFQLHHHSYNLQANAPDFNQNAVELNKQVRTALPQLRCTAPILRTPRNMTSQTDTIFVQALPPPTKPLVGNTVGPFPLCKKKEKGEESDSGGTTPSPLSPFLTNLNVTYRKTGAQTGHENPDLKAFVDKLLSTCQDIKLISPKMIIDNMASDNNFRLKDITLCPANIQRSIDGRAKKKQKRALQTLQTNSQRSVLIALQKQLVGIGVPSG